MASTSFSRRQICQQLFSVFVIFLRRLSGEDVRQDGRSGGGPRTGASEPEAETPEPSGALPGRGLVRFDSRLENIGNRGAPNSSAGAAARASP